MIKHRFLISLKFLRSRSPLLHRNLVKKRSLWLKLLKIKAPYVRLIISSLGNLCMKENQFEEALACYTKAIELSPNYAVYYCNRAAAYSRLNEHHKAIEDCQRALKIDPNYSKAYGRLGIAYSSLGEHAKAAAAYRKRLELDPTNENCQQNLNLTEERLGETRNAPSSGSIGGSGFDFGAVLNNPMMQNIAFQLLRDPHAQNVMADLFSSTFSGAPSSNASANVASPMADAAPSNQNAPNGDHPPASSEQTTSQPNMDQFMRLGQQLAQQLRATNPQLVDQLRQNFQSSFSSPDATDSAP
ncbi:hypothetical protein P879_02332 [Paragonimus westermani]|uniref:Small glutamine-rich tetratricopeptide repeat-containing protein alpha n=1 Tax=Paragonimus westermani TaxID=34504 RepID=A0A8T0DNQ9_9TREM|nr:hypothetical protein P879_02332 [Paragonimus westermani]